MDVLIVGVGVIGKVYGTHLSAAGHTIAVLTHGKRTDQVRQAGLRIREAPTGTHLDAAVDAVASATGAPYDLVLVAVRYDQLASASTGLTDLPGQPTVLFFGNNPRGGAGLPAVLSGQVRIGFPGIGGSFTNGIVTYARIPQQPTALDTGPSPIIDQLDLALHQQGFATQRVTDMDGWLAYHAVFVASVSSARHLCDSDPARLAQDHQTLTLMCRAVSEGFAALRRRGVGEHPPAWPSCTVHHCYRSPPPTGLVPCAPPWGNYASPPTLDMPMQRCRRSGSRP